MANVRYTYAMNLNQHYIKFSYISFDKLYYFHNNNKLL